MKNIHNIYLKLYEQFVPNVVKQNIRENREDSYLNHSNKYKTIFIHIPKTVGNTICKHILELQINMNNCSNTIKKNLIDFQNLVCIVILGTV